MTRSVVAATVALAIAGCGAGTTHQSAPAGPTDKSKAQVIQMPSGFRNLAIKCVLIQGQWFVVVSGSAGGSHNDLPTSPGVAAAPRCTHYGG